MSMESAASLASEHQARLFDVTKRYIHASSSVSGFSSQTEAEYEKSLSHLHQSYLHFFEQEGLKMDSTEVESLDNVLEGVKTRVDILRRCQRPLFQSIPKFYDLQLKEMLDHASKVIHKNLDAQICAVFLIDKQGRLSRQSLYGITPKKQILDSKWLPGEAYAIDNSTFVGKTAVPSDLPANQSNGRRHTEIYYTDTAEADLKADDYIKEYTGDFGQIHEVITVPINNRNRTFGVLRIINKIDRRTQKVLRNGAYGERDFFYLSLFAAEIGYALLNLERDSNRRLFSSLLKQVTRPDHDRTESTQPARIKEFLDIALSFLVNNEALPFNFAVIRLFCQTDDNIEGEYRTASIAAFSPDLNDASRDNDPIKASDNTFVGITCTSKEHIVISDISPKLIHFHNRDWVQGHKFGTFCCFPLVCRSTSKEEKAFGTLSLYTAYKYSYDARIIELLQSLSDTIATFLFIEKSKSQDSGIDPLFSSVCDLSVKMDLV